MPIELDMFKRLDYYLSTGDEKNIKRGFRILYEYIKHNPYYELADQDVIDIWEVTIQPNPTITSISIRDAFTMGFS
jgi:hypothetical protein